MVYDQGSGDAAYDGFDVVAGQETLTTNGALRFVVGSGAHNAGYDANGNMTSRIEEGEALLLAYDQENRLVEVKRGEDTVIATFAYDGDGNRVKSDFGGTVTCYVGNWYEKTSTAETRYYYFGGKRVAMRAGSTLYYLFGDHLGSSSVSLRASDSNTLTQRYYPWGTIRPGPDNGLPTDYTFTGQKLDTSTGLMYYVARYYDPVLARFIQPDTIVPDPGNPQALNRYAYTLNNPVKYTDPSGHATSLDIGGATIVHPITGQLLPRAGMSDAAYSIMMDFGQVDDLEAMATISDLAASVHPRWERFLPIMGKIFIGTSTTGAGALSSAALAGRKAGIGREPHDNPGATHYFSDKGFHEDFQDGHNQPYHTWGYIAQTATPGAPIAYILGRAEAEVANTLHECGQSLANFEQGWGTSWQDYVLSEAAMDIGMLITLDQITPRDLGNTMRLAFGPEGGGSAGMLQRLQGFWGPLRGSPNP